MAKILLTQPTLYFQGQVTLFQGDEWNVGFQVVDNFNAVVVPLNASSLPAPTAFFPAASGGSIPVLGSWSDGANGFGAVVVPTQITQNLGSLDPTSWYVQIALPGLETIQTPDQPLIIIPPQFNS